MYKILIHNKALKYYENLDKIKAKRINKAIEILSDDPFQSQHVKKLKGLLEGKYRFASGDLRIVYSVNTDNKTIFIEAIGSRGNIYK
ncbi:type II toxin-antitoxin system RelE/ParE family toxin [Candidatus Sumerlaeota bacterium]|nr:type II toxin-antitoxin system RelE/ParE family toxin [Candidatus Sumerlaeota bacterium]